MSAQSISAVLNDAFLVWDFYTSSDHRRSEVPKLATDVVTQSDDRVSNRHIHRYVMPTLKILKIKQDKEGFFRRDPPKPPAHRNTYLDWNYDAEIYSFGKRLGEDLKKDVLQQALLHRSYVLQEVDRQKEVGIEDPESSMPDNTEMIEEGEKLMSTFIFAYLCAAYPKVPEEGIRTIHDYLMTDETLAHVSSTIGTTELIMCREHPVEKETLAKTLKALVACVHQSSSLSRAHLFVRDFVLPQLVGKDVSSIWWIDNPHEVLKTILKNEGKPDPEPRLIGDSAKNTIFANYRVGLYINKEFLSSGSGETIETAHELATHDALRRFFGITESDRAFPFDLNVDSIDMSSKNLSIKDWNSKDVKVQTVERIASSG